jgi:ATP-binding cassette subfamily B protein
MYNAPATYGAIAACICLGLLQVLLLAVLGLYADLLTHQGHIPALSHVDIVWLNGWLGTETTEEVRHAVEKGEGVGLLATAWRAHQEERWYDAPIIAFVWLMSWTQSNGSYLTGLLLITIVLALLWCTLAFLLEYLAGVATVEAASRLRRAVYHQTSRLGTLAFRALGTSEAIGLFTRHIETIIEGLYKYLTVTFRAPAAVATLFIFALLVEWGASGGPPWLTVASLMFALLFWLIEGQLAAYFRRQERRNAMQATEQIALLQESLQILRLVKCYLMELFNQSRVERQLSRYARTLKRRYHGKAIFVQILVFLGVLAGAVLLYLAGWNILTGTLGVGATVTVLAALASMYWPIWDWLSVRRTLRRARQASAVVFQYLDRKGDVGQLVQAEFLPPLGEQLEFDGVSIKEPGTGRILLQDVSFTIRSGERVGIVGQDDLEKHALVYLIPRFLDPKEGQIRIDGKDLRWITLESLRLQVALVLQHNLVFNDTVANNIGCGDPAYTLPQIIEAAKVAHAHHFIQKLPHGYETRIGELGLDLGVSEKFRIALARAILRDPALVIIEEPTTPLDDDTKALLEDTYNRFLPERTTLFLPHRMSTIKSCDRIYLLNNGRLEASGQHRELINQSDLYRHIQYLEFNVFAEQS